MAKKYNMYKDSHRKIKGMKQKRCGKCKKWKEESEFHKDRARRDGFRFYCKGCAEWYRRKHYRKNRKTVREHLRYEDRHRAVRGVKEKFCYKCRRWKSESEFYKNSRSKDGLASLCQDCGREYKRERYKKVGKGLKTYRRYEERHRVVDGVKQKRCWKCKRWKAESEFYKNRSRKDGLQLMCKKCSNKATNKSRKKRQLAVKNWGARLTMRMRR